VEGLFFKRAVYALAALLVKPNFTKKL